MSVYNFCKNTAKKSSLLLLLINFLLSVQFHETPFPAPDFDLVLHDSTKNGPTKRAYQIAISINLITYRIGNYPIAPFEKQIKCKRTKWIQMRKVKIQNSWNCYKNYSVSVIEIRIFSWPLIDYYLQINTSCNTTIKTII